MLHPTISHHPRLSISSGSPRGLLPRAQQYGLIGDAPATPGRASLGVSVEPTSVLQRGAGPQVCSSTCGVSTRSRAGASWSSSSRPLTSCRRPARRRRGAPTPGSGRRLGCNLTWGPATAWVADSAARFCESGVGSPLPPTELFERRQDLSAAPQQQRDRDAQALGRWAVVAAPVADREQTARGDHHLSRRGDGGLARQRVVEGDALVQTPGGGKKRRAPVV